MDPRVPEGLGRGSRPRSRRTGLTQPEPSGTGWPVTPAAWEQAARERLDDVAWAYYAGGAGDEITLRDNENAWRRWALRPRTLVDVSTIDTRVTVLGQAQAHPVICAPTAHQVGVHPGGEIALARACASTATPYCLSSSGSTTADELAAADPGGVRWFQLYLRGSLASGIAALASVADLGYSAAVLTVDLPVLGIRDRERTHPWPPDPAHRTVASSGGSVPALDPAAIGRLAASCPVPLLVKGILDPRDARLAVEAGAGGIVVSNHGGRQLDGVLATADVLADIVAEVAGDAVVLVDGGIRRGTDVVTALSLGAAAVLVGRLPLWGLAVGGEDGAAAVLSQLLDEVRVALALLGVPRAVDLGPEQVVRAPWR